MRPLPLLGLYKMVLGKNTFLWSLQRWRDGGKLSVFLHYFSLLIITPQPIHGQKEMLWWLIRVRSMIVSLGLWIKSLSSLKSRAHGLWLLRHCHIVRCHRPGWQFPSEKGLWEVTPTCYILSTETYTLSYFPPCASCEQIDHSEISSCCCGEIWDSDWTWRWR